jgi:peptidoglycan-associated lipoprotein
MKTLPLILCAALALSACANNRFGDNPNEPLDGGIGAGTDSGAIVPGSANDPRSVAYFQQAVGDRVLFAVDQHVLTPNGQATLQAQARWLMENPDYTAVIEGHADEQGTREYNIGLGERRAESAKTFLISQGVSPARLRTVSFGKERPIEICSEEACYAKNRRAVTVLATGLTG